VYDHDSTKKTFQNRYNVKRYDRIFDRAARIEAAARNIRSEEERRWTRLMEQHLFKDLIAKSSRIEGNNNDRRADRVINQFRVYVLTVLENNNMD